MDERGYAVSTPPSLSEFTTAVRETFSFLGHFGFREVAAPAHRARDPFKIWFGAGDRFVVVAGEGYGTMASVTLEHDGRELSEIYLRPVMSARWRRREGSDLRVSSSSFAKPRGGLNGTVRTSSAVTRRDSTKWPGRFRHTRVRRARDELASMEAVMLPGSDSRPANGSRHRCATLLVDADARQAAWWDDNAQLRLSGGMPIGTSLPRVPYGDAPCLPVPTRTRAARLGKLGGYQATVVAA